MSELHRRFITIQSQRPEFGAVIIMWYAVNGMKYSKDTIRKVFNLCVPKDEYDKEDKPELIEHLCASSSGYDDPYKIKVFET